MATFYENIIGAVVDQDPSKTCAILGCFDFLESMSIANRVMNVFEASIVSCFLSKHLTNELRCDETGKSRTQDSGDCNNPAGGPVATS